MDRISNLPDFILHRIMSFLHRKDAARTCVLSKRWTSIWDSFPIFEFNQHLYIKDNLSLTSEYKEKVRGFLNVVDKSLQKFSQKKLLMQRLSFVMDRADHSFVSEIDRWMFLALNNGVREISFRISTELNGVPNFFYPLPKTLFAVKSFNGSSTLVHLQSLSLQWVDIRENIIQDITRNCPNLKYFALQEFGGLKTIEISKLDKLESVSIVDAQLEGLDSVSVDAPKLKYFNFGPFYLNMPYKISLISCHDLKELHIRCCGVTDDWLHLYLSRFPFLEKLEVGLCPRLRRVRISGQELKTFRLTGCENIERIEIDAPNLSLFYLRNSTIPVLVPENVSCPMQVEYSSNTERGKVESSLFHKLRKFLGDWPQREYIFVEYFVNNKVCFDFEELRQLTIPPLIKIDHLKVTSLGRKASVDCATFIDGLLWSCHPMTISVPPGSSFLNNFIKVLCKTLLDREYPSCCVSSEVKCWRHELKAVKIESFGGIEDDRLLHLDMLLDTLPSLTKYQEVRLNLEWEF